MIILALLVFLLDAEASPLEIAPGRASLGRRKTRSSSRTGGGGSSSNAANNAGSRPFRTITSSYSNRGFSSFSSGGGPRTTVPSSLPFAGREVGGGTRAEIHGTRRYGSGYPYGPLAYTGSSYGAVRVNAAPFPFGFWPIGWYWPYAYAASYDYSAASPNNSSRPGGGLELITVSSDDIINFPTLASEEQVGTYMLLGDNESLGAIMDVLRLSKSAQGCAINKYTTEAYPNTANIAQTIGPQNVVQWYRASSFALGFTGFNNSRSYYPANETDTITFDDSDPLPSSLVDSAFLQCLNHTIGEALPILDPPAEKKKFKPTPWQIALLVMGGIVALPGFVALLVLTGMCVKKIFRRRGTRTTHDRSPLRKSGGTKLPDLGSRFDKSRLTELPLTGTYYVRTTSPRASSSTWATAPSPTPSPTTTAFSHSQVNGDGHQEKKSFVNTLTVPPAAHAGLGHSRTRSADGSESDPLLHSNTLASSPRSAMFPLH